MPRSCWLHMEGDEVITEWSFGIIPVAVRDGVVSVFLIQSYSGSWLFPKGHAESGETSQESAARELMEETGLVIDSWIEHPPFVERYSFMRGPKAVHKEVLYFPAYVSGEVCLQKDEVKNGRWTPLYEASKHVTFPEIREISWQFSTWFENFHAM